MNLIVIDPAVNVEHTAPHHRLSLGYGIEDTFPVLLRECVGQFLEHCEQLSRFGTHRERPAQVFPRLRGVHVVAWVQHPQVAIGQTGGPANEVFGCRRQRFTALLSRDHASGFRLQQTPAGDDREIGRSNAVVVASSAWSGVRNRRGRLRKTENQPG